MSFLYEMPLDETKPEFTELHELLVSAYPSRKEAQIIARRSGLKPGRFPSEGDLYIAWHELILRLANQGVLPKLIEYARDDPNIEGLKEQFESYLAGSPAIRMPEPEISVSWKKPQNVPPDSPVSWNYPAGGFEGVVELLVVTERARLRKVLQDALKDPTVEELGQLREMLPSPAAPEPKSGSKPSGMMSKSGSEPTALPAEPPLERIIVPRQNRMLPLEIAGKIMESGQSVVRLSLHFGQQRAYGNAFLIQPNLLLTAHHVLHVKGLGTLEKVTADFDYLQGYSVSKRNPVACRIESIVGDAQQGWAVIELERPVDRKLLPLGSPVAIEPGNTLIIIQHYLGGAKQFSLENEVFEVRKERLFYKAETGQGSSGAPLFNGRLQVVAVHYASTRVKDMFGQGEWFSEGIRAELIAEGLSDAGIPFVSG